jgi:hypothetical protein
MLHHVEQKKLTSNLNKLVASIFRVCELQGESFWATWTHKMEAASSSKMLIATYKSQQSYITVEYILNSLVITSIATGMCWQVVQLCYCIQNEAHVTGHGTVEIHSHIIISTPGSLTNYATGWMTKESWYDP